MAKINFTAARVADFQCPPEKTQDFLWDAAAPGLGLCVSKTSRAYVFQSRINGKPFRLTIGKIAAWRLSEARAYANELQVMVDKGIDPRRVKAEQAAAEDAARTAGERTAARQAVTLADAWAVYLAERKARWSAGHYANHVNLAALGGEAKKRGKGLTVAGPLAPLMPLPLTALTSDRISTWLDAESATRATNAGQSFRLLRAFATWAYDMPEYSGLVPADAFSTRKVKEAVPKNQAKHGDSLERGQLKLWFAAVRQMTNPIFSTYLQGLLLTGARRTELASLRWSDVDLQWGKMTIADKVEGTRTIPIPPYLSSLFAALPRHNEWVFGSTAAKSGHIEAPTKAHQAALKVAGLPHVSIHGLRRSFRTLTEWVDAPSGIVAQIMGHKPSAVAERHYTRREIGILREWHTRIEAWILAEAGIEWK